jgi:hypothetical protein
MFVRLGAAIALALLTAGAAQAQVRQFIAGDCFTRSYDAQHLRAHPRQTVRFFYLRPAGPEWRQATARGQSTYNFGMRLIGRPGLYSGVAMCRPRFDTLACQIEGDGGAFTLYQRGRQLEVAVERLQLEGARDFSPDIAERDNAVIRLNRSARGACPRG